MDIEYLLRARVVELLRQVLLMKKERANSMETTFRTNTNTKRVYWDLLQLLALKREYDAAKLAQYSLDELVEELEDRLKAQKEEEDSALTHEEQQCLLQKKLACSDLAAHMLVAIHLHAKEQQTRYIKLKDAYNEYVDKYNEMNKQLDQVTYNTAVRVAREQGYSGDAVYRAAQKYMELEKRNLEKTRHDKLQELLGQGFKMLEEQGCMKAEYDEKGYAKHWDDKKYHPRSSGQTDDVLAVGSILNSLDPITEEQEIAVCYAEAVLRRFGICDKTLQKVHRRAAAAPVETEQTLDTRMLQTKFEQAQAAAKYLSLDGAIVVMKDGTIQLMDGEETDYQYVLQESNVKKVCDLCGSEYTLLLLRNGRVKLVGNPAHSDYTFWQKDIAETGADRKLAALTGIVDAVGGYSNVFVLTHEGRVQHIPFSKNNDKFAQLSNWTSIQQVAASSEHVVGLRQDGTVVACGNNDHGQCNVGRWKDIIAVAADENYLDMGGKSECYGFTLGLTRDGRVLFAGDVMPGREREHRQITAWRNVVQISTCSSGVCALTAHGTAKRSRYSSVYSFYDTAPIYKYDAPESPNKVFMDDETDMEQWTGMVAAFWYRGIGADGSVSGSSVRLFEDLNDLMLLDAQAEEENAELLAEEQRREEARLAEEQTKVAYRRMKLCQHCGGSFKGLFKKVCTACGKQKDY